MSQQPVDNSPYFLHQVTTGISFTYDCNDELSRTILRGDIDVSSGNIFREGKKLEKDDPCGDVSKQFKDKGQWRSTVKPEVYLDYDLTVHDSYKAGYVVIGTAKTVHSLLNADELPKIGTHGVILNNKLAPSFEGLYEEGTFQNVKELGNGSFGSVCLCIHTSGQEYVTKSIKEKFNRKEVEVLMQLDNPYIIKFFGYIIREGVHEILMENGGQSLNRIIEQKKTILTFEMVCKLSNQGFSALHYMWEVCRILHLDIKPENMCVTFSPLCLKFTDFGTSKTLQQPISFVGWTPEYTSPEACRRFVVSQSQLSLAVPDLTGAADVFSFGLVICYMQTGEHVANIVYPRKCDRAEFRSMYIIHIAKNPDFVQQIAVRDEWCPEMKMLLLSVLVGDPSKRLTAKGACQMIRMTMLNQVPIVVSSSVDQEVVNAPRPPSPMDCRPSGGGKDVRDRLRQKLRQKVSAPYPASPAIARTSVDDKILPDFDQLMD